MTASMTRMILAGAVSVIGSAVVIGCAAISLFDSGSPATARTLGIAPALAARDPLVTRATMSPGSITAAEQEAARATIRRQPLLAAPYYVLGAARAGAGTGAAVAERRTGGALVDAALRLDPRLAPALFWRTREAITAGRYKLATEYDLRLLSLRPQDKAPLDLLVLLSRRAETRQQVVAALARTPDWRRSFLSALSMSGVSRNYLYRAIETGSPVEGNLADERSMFLTDLIAKQDYERAYTAWVSWLPDDALSSIDFLYDGAFRGRPGAPPFNWQLGTVPNAFASIEPGRGLALTFDGASDAVLAQQIVLLTPGRYRIVTTMAKVETGQADAVPTMFWRLTCAGQTKLLADAPVTIGRQDARTASAAIEIAADCPAISLELRVKAQTYPAQTSATMRSVSIEAVS